MSFKDLSIEEYNHALGEKKSTPGGGSALAITLSLACSLLLMVMNFTLDKKGYEEHQKRMVELKENITRIQEEAFVAASLCLSIYPGCKDNIEINISSVKDASFIEQMKSIF